MGSPRVSVLMPVYGGERHLAAAVESVLGQSFGDLELIAVDDASPDGSNAVLRGYTDARLRLIVHERNGGQTEALRTALAAARGELVARLDQDDIAYPERFARQVRHLDSHPEVCLVGTGYVLIDDEGKEIAHGASGYGPIGPRELAWRFVWTDMLVDSSLMMRRQAVERAGGFDPKFRYAQDFDLESRLCGIGEPARLEEELVALRLHSASSSSQFVAGQEREVCIVIAGALEHILGEPVGEAAALAIGRALGRLPAASSEDVRMTVGLALRALPAFLERARVPAADRLAMSQAALELLLRMALRHPRPWSGEALSIVLKAIRLDPLFPFRPSVWRSRWRRLAASRRYHAAVSAAWRPRADGHPA